MTKMYLAIAAVFFLFVIPSLIIKFQPVDFNPAADNQLRISYQNQKISENDLTNKSVIEIQYPKVMSTDQQSENIINQKINGLVSQIKDDFNTGLTVDKLPLGDNIKNQLTTNYQVYQLDTSRISIRFDTTDYQRGMAHPVNTIKTFNFDLKQRKEINLGDLFIPDSNYLQALSKIAKEDLIANLQKDWPDTIDMIETGTKPIAENYKNFVLEKGNLIIIFPQYQVAPGAAGEQKVIIPFSKIRDILSK